MCPSSPVLPRPTVPVAGTMYSEMPIIHIDCAAAAKAVDSEEIYECPMYRTSSRGTSDFVMFVDLPSLHHEPSHWTLRGVALYGMLGE